MKKICKQILLMTWLLELPIGWFLTNCLLILIVELLYYKYILSRLFLLILYWRKLLNWLKGFSMIFLIKVLRTNICSFYRDFCKISILSKFLIMLWKWLLLIKMENQFYLIVNLWCSWARKWLRVKLSSFLFIF